MAAFHYELNKYTYEIICTAPSGLKVVIAEAENQYWADAIVYALEMEREIREG
jgi:hypothetical protein